MAHKRILMGWCMLLLAVLACSISFDGGGKPSAADMTQEALDLQVTLQVQPEMQATTTTRPPDPCLIAFDTDRDGEYYRIYLMDAASGEVRRLSPQGDWEDHHASWSPDGTRIAYVSMRDGNKEIYVMAVDGSQDIRMTTNEGDDYWPAWSPDGMQIAYASDRDGEYDIFLLGLDGSAEQQLTYAPGDDFVPVWVPDGGLISFTSNRGLVYDVFIMDKDGGSQKQLIKSMNDDRTAVFSPQCSSDIVRALTTSAGNP